ncbi:MAG TPA: DUF6385 domain-containing protein [Nitrosarchaeum sp.]|nr:DUF6385 domain-containing protein [Nitrosarchaeum sp.]
MSENIPAVIQNVSSQLMTYPADGSRKKGAQAGKYILDFAQGLVTPPSGASESMSKSLSKIGSQFCRSVFVTVSTVDAVIKIGQNVLPKSHQLTYVIQGIAFDTMEITFPSDRIPLNDFSFAVVGSDSVNFPLQADSLVGFHNPDAKTGNTTDAYVSIVDFLFTGYSNSEIIIENTGGTNIMTADVQVSEDGTNFVSAQSYPLDVAINDFNIFQNAIRHRYIRVRLKSKNAGNHTTYRVQLNLER